ncbi:MAG TPA: nucleoside triphosphate pyrophosphohydrolase [Abditibacteriaceae bacterium]|jgi:tetrapyrrole methylase family protein/MazG family protein
MKLQTPAEAFEQLHGIIARLRAPDGCPWDREQTHETLRAHLLEEAYETLDAIDRKHDADLCEELGDLLMQPLMHADIAKEEKRFDIVDVLNGISEKLIRRHPHVFGETVVADSGEVLRNWDAIKKQEKAERGVKETSVLDGVPDVLPSLTRALKISKKAAKVGFEWPDITGVLDKLREETAEIEVEIAAGDDARLAEELGDLLFTAVNIARWRKIDPELALRDGVARFEGRFRAMEAAATARGLELKALSPAEWDALWNEAKNRAA